MTRPMASRQGAYERRERLLTLAVAIVEGVVLCAALLGLCALVVALFILLAPSGAALPGVTG